MAAKVAIEPVLRRLVVVRRHDQRAISPESPGALRPLDRGHRAVGTGSGQDRHSPRRRFDRRGNDPIPLGGRERRSLAGRSAGHETGDSAFDLTLDKSSQCRLVDHAVPKWSDERSETSRKFASGQRGGHGSLSFVCGNAPPELGPRLADEPSECGFRMCWSKRLAV